ncbi:MAG: hypothetical protein LBQ64_04160 [Bacteroidales bacterium]|jgi:hypothetical protein|nr:hypothetical protein [Bacteroidales bacterium]
MNKKDKKLWLTQKMLATLYDVKINTVNYHIKKIFDDRELELAETIRNFRIVQIEGNKEVG